MRKVSTVQRIVRYYLDAKDIEDNMNYKRYVKPAKQLLELTGSYKKSIEAIDKIKKWADDKCLEWEIETIFKRYLDVIQKEN